MLEKNMSISVRWMGINALEFRHSQGAFLIDPYVSRDREKLTIPEEVDRYLDGPADFILMTHSHWDHLPDVPRIIARTGAVLLASKTACNIMRKVGVPEDKLHELSYEEVVDLPGNVRVTALESRHMEPVGAPGCYQSIPEVSMQERAHWLCGEVFAYLIEVEGQRILNAGSANLHLPAVDQLQCDGFFCGISRWKPGFPELIGHIQFSRLYPTHHDDFVRPLDEFSLRDDFVRLKTALPDLEGKELPVLQWMELPQIPADGKA